MSVVIKVENLSKQYRLGEVGTGSMKDDIKRWRYKMMGKEDPFLTIGEENDRTVKANSKYVWALKDINFQVQQGEILGIVGRNGAGKSTLLKILSRTTGPTKGTLKMKGRVASLLEVGTGFHGELSGRENIYLNGAIMGMQRQEITRKLDEIVDFAGVEKYIDTPVKRYSSGMYVRLAFGVAAHLETDIMIVDEVLAVGDTEFQKKALGKMKNISQGQGRTVLFVSHNMGTILQLCQQSILLKNGRIEDYGISATIVERYYNQSQQKSFSNGTSNKEIYFKEICTFNAKGEEVSSFAHSDDIHLRMKIGINEYRAAHNIGIALLTNNKVRVFTVNKSLVDFYQAGSNEIVVEFIIQGYLIAPMHYSFLVALNTRTGLVTYDYQEDICGIQVYDSGTEFAFAEGINYGSIILKDKWKLLK